MYISLLEDGIYQNHVRANSRESTRVGFPFSHDVHEGERRRKKIDPFLSFSPWSRSLALYPFVSRSLLVENLFHTRPRKEVLDSPILPTPPG